MPATKNFPVFDCDSHVVEPPLIWEEYVPAKERAWVKSQFCFHTDGDLLMINGRVVPASRERSNAAEVGWARWAKSEIGAYTPGTPEWNARFGRLLGCRDPDARLCDMAALGIDQVMLFPTWFVRLALLRDPRAAAILARAYNDWVYDYCAPDRRRLYPCAVLPLQTIEGSIEELRRVAKLGFKAAAVRPCFWNGRYPTLPEFDPLWREFEALGIVLAMHTFPSREALTPEWGQRMDAARGSGHGLLFTDEAVVYSPGQFVSNITFAMDPTINSSEALGFVMEAMTWVTTVLMTGWLDKFPKLTAAVLRCRTRRGCRLCSVNQRVISISSRSSATTARSRTRAKAFTTAALSASSRTRNWSTACGTSSGTSASGRATIRITTPRTPGRRST